MYKKIFFAIIFLLVSGESALAQWQPPTAAPPGNNAPSPLNVSSVTQTKAADLVLRNLTLTTGPGSGQIRFGLAAQQYILGTNGSALEYYSNNSSNARLYFRNNTGGPQPLGGVYGEQAGAVFQFGLIDSLSQWFIRHATGNFTEFRVANNPIMTLLSNGNVGIGTTAPTEKLDVAGNIKASGSICNSAGCLGGTAAPPNLQQVTAAGNLTTIGSYFPQIIDTDNNGFSLDPSSTSILNGLYVSTINDRDNPATFFLDPNSVSVLNDVRSSVFIDRDDTTYRADLNNGNRINYILANNIDVFGFVQANQHMRATRYYDDDTNYFVDSNTQSRMNSIRLIGRLGTNDLDPDSGYQPGWGGGIHTFDVQADGSIYSNGTVFSNGSPVCQSNGGNCPPKPTLSSAYEVSDPNSGLGTDLNMGDHFACFLTFHRTTSEDEHCEIFPSGSAWILRAYNFGDGSLTCGARCIDL